ncbi:MAG TPA: S8 family serine peptidase [Candidatus Eisenbacteria bacterium]|nr:S8 family serine peptidase [Candidatus Eisenbacteria bacterium]
MRRSGPISPLQRTLLVFLVAAAMLGTMPADAARSVHPALTRPIDPSLPLHQRFLGTDLSGGRVVELLIEGEIPPGLLRSRGIEVNTVTGRLMTARCPLGLLNALLSMPGIDRVSISEPCVRLLEQSAVDVGLPSIRTVAPPDFTGQTGEGVLVGIVDTGVDLGHSDFQNPDGTTRLVSVWDQTVNGAPPAGFTYGTEWSSAQIDAGQASEVDDEGHGTHVLGTAGGDGSETGNGVPAHTYVGVAPEADLCVVKTNFGTTSIIDGVNYIFQRGAALGKQTVVNLSLGSQQGPHDGTFGFDTMVNALTGPGKIVVASAGNQQENDLHGQIAVSGAPGIMTLAVPTYGAKGGPSNDYMLFSGWYEGANQISLTIQTPNGHVIGPVSTGNSASLNSPDGFINLNNATTIPANGDHEIYVEIYDATANRTPEPGTWTFTFTPVVMGSSGRVDMYTFVSNLGPGALARWGVGLQQDGVIGTPGTADSVITVGAHTTKECWDSIDGNGYCWTPLQTLQSIAPFSSLGPRRDGAIKPDLTGPGFGVASSKSANYNPSVALVVPDGVHHVEAGTSMSAPHVAGAVALLLAQPAWSGSSPSAIKARLKQTARTDSFTGTVPNTTWGSGKLNVAAALAPLASVLVPYPPDGANLPYAKWDSIQVVITGAVADSVELHLSLEGGSTYPTSIGKLYNVSPGPPRTLPFQPQSSMATQQAKIRATAYTTSGTLEGFSDGLFTIAIPTAVEPVATASAPRFELGRNSPNPFNPSTTIAFAVDHPGRVTLRIFDARGSLVRTLVNGRLDAGAYRSRWDGTSDHGARLASGIYLYRLDLDGRSLSRKMTLLQ